MKRTLSLKRESLTELAPDELTSVVGGVTGPGPGTISCTGCQLVPTVLASCPC